MQQSEKYFEETSLWNKKVNEIENNRIRKVIQEIPEDALTLLDVGCGNGILVNSLAKSKTRKFKRIHGFDRSHSALQFVNTEKSQGDITQTSFSNNEFDIVICLEVLEHLPVEAFEKTISEISRISSKYILISVPNNEKLEDHFVKCQRCHSTFHFTNHLHSFDNKTIGDLFVKHGFTSLGVQLIGRKIVFKLITPLRRYFRKRIKGKVNHTHTIYCPVCGFRIDPNSTKVIQNQDTKIAKNGMKSFIRKIWPKKYEYNWILAKYQYSIDNH